MRVIKNINNNVAVCVDNSGQEVIVFGKGVGFRKPPYEIPLAKIERTYYDVDPKYISMIQSIPPKVIEVSDAIVAYAERTMDMAFNSNIVFTLADHIAFAIKREQQHMKLSMPMTNDIENLYPHEWQAGVYGLKEIRRKCDVYLPREEASYIALHLINSEAMDRNNESMEARKVIEDITRIVEDSYGIQIERHGFNYARFETHMFYLLKRRDKASQISTDNAEMFHQLKEKYPKVYETSKQIAEYLQKNMHMSLNEEETMYLMLHINRLCTREDCYQ